MSGNFALMLHSHIPYCRKSGVWPAGEEWLFEAMNETYIPLLSMLRRFQQQGKHPKIMIGIVPILAEQLNDSYMKSRFCEYMEDKIRRAQEDMRRFDEDPQRRAIAEFWYNTFSDNYRAFTDYFYTDILGTFKWLQDEGVIEVLTSAATHGFLPLLERDSSIYSQIRVGVETYKKYFGQSPKGFWLPECAYRPQQWSDQDKKERKAIDEWLAAEGIEYFFVENVGITEAQFIQNKNNEKRPTTYRGYKLESGVHVFGRNPLTGKQVWSAESGYPGNEWYREFHKKDLESGLHYWRITKSEDKELYNPEKAFQQVREDAQNFVELVVNSLANRSTLIDETNPIIVSMYDCELFGHWWMEGVTWLEQVYSLLLNYEEIQVDTLSSIIERKNHTYSVIRMKPSTWGENSDFTVWNNPKHAWLWPYINASANDFEFVLASIVQSNRVLTERDKRIIAQTGRELLLLEGSDWPFLLYTQQAREYANKRFHNHHQRFNKLLWALKDLNEHQRIGDRELQIIEEIDNPFSDFDWKMFLKQ